MRPGYGTPKPVDVNVNIFVNSFGAISAQDFFKGVTFRMRHVS